MIDPTTGFPKVKDDQFWRVVRAESGVSYFCLEEYVRVELVDKTTGDLLGVRTLEEGDVNRENLLEYAGYIVAEVQNREGVDALLGCYPPNKL